MKACAVAPAVLLATGAKKAKIEKEGVEVPFLPTLEWLREYNENVLWFSAEYSSRGTWTAIVYRRKTGLEIGELKARGKSGQHYSIYDWPWMAFLHWEDGEWFAIDRQWRDDNGKVCYHAKKEWPDWLRKF